jgi:hypothetical protein
VSIRHPTILGFAGHARAALALFGCVCALGLASCVGPDLEPPGAPRGAEARTASTPTVHDSATGPAGSTAVTVPTSAIAPVAPGANAGGVPQTGTGAGGTAAAAMATAPAAAPSTAAPATTPAVSGAAGSGAAESGTPPTGGRHGDAGAEDAGVTDIP